MTMDVLMGENEAYTRLRKELHQGNPNGIEYPTATNNRGHLGGGHEPSDKAHDTRKHHGHHGHPKREHHAMGDRVGDCVQPGRNLKKPMKRGGEMREEHGWGDAIGGAFKKAGSAMGRGIGGAARAVGSGMQTAGKAVGNFSHGESIGKSGKVPNSFSEPGEHLRQPRKRGEHMHHRRGER